MFKKNLRKFSLLSIQIFVLVLMLTVSFGVYGANNSLNNPIGTTDFTKLAESIIEWIVNIGILIAVFMIIYSGILFMISRGNDEDITKAKKALMWSLIGLAILIMGKTWITLIKSILS